MSIIGPDGRPIGLSSGLLPKEQRILAPSLVNVVDSHMGSPGCACSLRITDLVNLTVYYVPCTPQMAQQIRRALRPHDPEYETPTITGDDAA
jgi:hypothetical protein